MIITDGNPIDTAALTIGGTESNPIIDVRVSPLATGDDREEVVAFPRLDKLTALVTLDAYGDDATALIPSDKSGDGKLLTFVVFDRLDTIQAGPETSTSWHT